MKKALYLNCIAIIISALWICLSEFIRNEWLFKNCWVQHYSQLGIAFHTNPVNGLVWFIWSLLYAFTLFALSKKFDLIKTSFLGWLYGFPMMWLVLGNLQVLPFSILWAAIPLSLLEVLVASYIISKLTR